MDLETRGTRPSPRPIQEGLILMLEAVAARERRAQAACARQGRGIVRRSLRDFPYFSSFKDKPVRHFNFPEENLNVYFSRYAVVESTSMQDKFVYR